jgi:multiple sugar transport system substrate-binding protein
MADSTSKMSFTRRRLLQTSAGALGAAGTVGLYAPAVVGQAKPFAGETINVSTFSGPYPKMLQSYIPEFEELTGITVNYDTPGFAIYNQRADLELSTQGSAYDVLNVTFIYTSRWIGAGWFTPLEEFLDDPNKTPADWNKDDFLEGTLAPMRGTDGSLYGIPWIADAMMAAATRYDLMEKEGLKMPETFEEMEVVCKAINNKEPGLAGFINENHHGWTFPPYLQGYGGNIFVDPPDNLMPTLDSAEAIEAADYYAAILRNYGPDGVLSYTYDQVVAALQQGRANYITFNHAFILQAADKEKSKVADTISFSLMPGGPKGRRPGLAVHAFGIPVGSQKKDAAWEFIKWSLSKETMARVMQEKGYGSVTRASLINSPEFKQRMQVNGIDMADLYVKTIEISQQGYMKYRTVAVYPQVDKQLDKAIENIVSGQMSAAEAMKLAQQNSISDLKRSGLKL